MVENAEFLKHPAEFGPEREGERDLGGALKQRGMSFHAVSRE